MTLFTPKCIFLQKKKENISCTFIKVVQKKLAVEEVKNLMFFFLHFRNLENDFDFNVGLL